MPRPNFPAPGTLAAALQDAVQCPVTVAWTGGTTLRVAVGGDVDLTWELEMGTTAITRRCRQ
ncbi:hypothetical protein [Arthrobacter globiformis]|uniref:hypothetical protein n=1 Tax=Arthrobacter globiformis TaxID=1665 RepID=UPI001FDF5C8F|nr:hypothetical protein [Arthrobacter globiformis]